jgi:site-specific DNA-methyltransferase (adenine-specific)
MARKPFKGGVAANVLEHGVGGINIDASRIEGEPVPINVLEQWSGFGEKERPDYKATVNDQGRWPANVLLDEDSGALLDEIVGDNVSRFFYCAKASKKEKGAGNGHATVKPLDLMRYLVRLVTPPGGLVLDQFMGTGSTGIAAVEQDFRFLGFDMKPEHVDMAHARFAERGLSN